MAWSSPSSAATARDDGRRGSGGRRGGPGGPGGPEAVEALLLRSSKSSPAAAHPAANDNPAMQAVALAAPAASWPLTSRLEMKMEMDRRIAELFLSIAIDDGRGAL